MHSLSKLVARQIIIKINKMKFFNKKKILVTHNSTFHADDVFATAALAILYKDNIRIIRTRDEELIRTADVVYDVGGIDDPLTDRFDHHQIGGAGKRTNGIPYAAFGLVWKKYGETICGSSKCAVKIDEHLVQAIDANDNGMDLFKDATSVSPYLIQNAFYSFRPSWKEDQDYDKAFMKAVNIAKQILEREIKKTRDAIDGEALVHEAYSKSEDKRLLILDTKLPWEEVATSMGDPLIVVAPRPDGKWKAEAVFLKQGSIERKIKFPASWAGLRDQALAEESGVPDAVFCHNGLFMVVSLSKQGAIDMALKCLAVNK